MPKYGCINERRHQLHEVIRLSGMNLIIDDADHPLIIKVASIQPARMQVYFIDNEEYFKRKAILHDDDGKEFADNDERSIFFLSWCFRNGKKVGMGSRYYSLSWLDDGVSSTLLKEVFRHRSNICRHKSCLFSL